ncbi:tetratricopeptide repeat protein [Glycomyces tenuis]|uniref:tetratricopeptide repeat protein n=1 Tax=Glycomyces tenuis TaxID=58116 RepID=UPI00041C2E86|nr:tetratricopeptide repeat protein [Glycomyces tenuis]
MPDESNERDATRGESIEPTGPVEYSNYFDDTEIHNFVQAHRIEMGALRPAKPREAPLPPPHWVDREQALAELRDHLGSGRRTPIVVTGPAGAGKSSLAAMLAVLLEERFADGQLYVDLGRDDPLTAMRSALGRLGEPKDQLSDTLTGLTAQYRSATRDKALLVIVDEAPSREAGLLFEPASRAAGFMVLGQRWPRDLDAVVHHVRDLEAEHAAKLLVNTCPWLTAAEAEEHVAGREWRPERVRHLAGLLSARHRSRAGSELGRESVAAYSTEDFIDATYRALSEPAAWLYRFLAALPGEEFDGDILAALSAADDTAFQELVDAQLVTRVRPDRYRLEGDAGRSDRVLPVDLTAALQVSLRWHVKRAQLADRKVMGEQRLRLGTVPAEIDCPAFESSGAALAWLHDNHRTLIGFVRTAALLGRREESWALAEAMWAFFTNLSYPEAAERCYRVAAESADEPAAKARMLICLGRTLIDLHEDDESERVLSEAVSLANAEGDRALLGSATEQLGWLSYRRGRFLEAEAMYTAALEIAEQGGRRRAQALQLKLLGLVYRDLGEPDRARLRFAKALAIFMQIQDARNIVIVRFELAALGAAAGEPGAVADADTAIGYLRDLGLERSAGEALERLGGILGGDEGRTRLEAALEIYERLGSGQAGSVRALLG